MPGWDIPELWPEIARSRQRLSDCGELMIARRGHHPERKDDNESINSGLEAVAAHFAEDGLTIEQLQDPLLMGRRADTLIANIEGVVSRFKEDGLTLKDHLQAATKQPSRFTQKPDTLIGNIEGVVGRFKDDGLLLRDYLRAATKQPSLFYQKPDTIIEHITIIKSLYK